MEENYEELVVNLVVKINNKVEEVMLKDGIALKDEIAAAIIEDLKDNSILRSLVSKHLMLGLLSLILSSKSSRKWKFLRCWKIERMKSWRRLG